MTERFWSLDHTRNGLAELLTVSRGKFEALEHGLETLNSRLESFDGPFGSCVCTDVADGVALQHCQY